MNNTSLEIRKYLSSIGRKGGLRSKRKLAKTTARQMLAVREARRAYRKFYELCFWSYDPNLKIALNDLPWVLETLMKNGNRSALDTAIKLKSYS